jgi:hypothetical protein
VRKQQQTTVVTLPSPSFTVKLIPSPHILSFPLACNDSAHPDEIANADEASFVTETEMRMDGGWWRVEGAWTMDCASRWEEKDEVEMDSSYLSVNN